MTNEEALELLKDVRMGINYKVNGTTQFSKALEIAIKALEQQPCVDCVSRSEVLDILQMKYSGNELYNVIYTLPSVTPQPCK